MALFHFHVRHEQGLVQDDEPLDLPDLSAVFAEAIQSAREFVADVTTGAGMQFEIADTEGSVVLKLPIEALAAAGEVLARSGLQSPGVPVH
jgi:uncharacterized protein (DUF849 family)